MAKGFGIPRRRALLEALSETDPARYEALVELRRYNPQAYRKAIRRLERGGELPPPEPGEHVSPPLREVVTLGAPAPRLTRAEQVRSSVQEGAAASAMRADMSVLELTIGKLRDALATGDHDPWLDALLVAEREGQARKGAIRALENRRQEVG